jgi:hypothetical protein
MGGGFLTGRRIIGFALLIAGLVAVLWGGVFWTDRDTVFDTGGIQIATEDREGFAVPPIVGAACMLAGAVLVMLPQRTRV